jgi:phage shock protein PspC (stress-responsive transcriptional regulator)
MERRLYRSQKDKIIGGVSGGLGEYFEIDPVIVRIVFVVLTVAGGWGVLAYALCWIIIPPNPAHHPSAVYDVQSPSPKKRKAGGETPPPTPQPPSRTPGTVGGIILVLLGVLLLGHNLVPRFDLWEYWPVILVLAGIGLLMKARPRTV